MLSTKILARCSTVTLSPCPSRVFRMQFSSYTKDLTKMEGKLSDVNLYDGHYSDHAKRAQTQVRLDTYGTNGDFGQSSWMTQTELDSMITKLKITNSSHVLEVGSGAGGTSVYIAKMIGCRVTGVDLNPHGIETGNSLANADGLSNLVNFHHADASKPLPFPDGSFDAVFSNDAMCHIPGRKNVLSDWRRLLKPGGLALFTDAMIVTGIVSSDEFATRSSIGKYYFVPLGQNEQVIEAARLQVLEAIDTTSEAAEVAKRWHDSREKHRDELQEPAENFEGLQKFLWSVYTLLNQKRLSRFMYIARKPETSK